jgi:hypothetical protein
MMRALVFLYSFLTGSLCANNVTVSNVTATTTSVTFNITWENSWYLNGTGEVPNNHDAVWIFVKSHALSCAIYEAQEFTHVTFNTALSAHTLIGNIAFARPIDAAPHNTGVMIRRSTLTNGIGPQTTSGTVTLQFATALDPLDLVRLRVFAIEMVQVPQGPFYVGDGHVEYWEFYDGSASTPANPYPPYHVTGTNITSGLTSGGGTQHFPVLPLNGSNYPTGYNEFYHMKYEISQGQYADFLNWIHVTTHFQHYLPGPIGTAYTLQGTWPYIHTGGQDWQAMHYMSAADLSAYLDWAALRPMSELEFEKACRGPAIPIIEEYAWGNAIWNPVTAVSGSGTGGTAVGCGVLPHLMVYHPFPHGLRCGFLGACGPGRTMIGAGYYGGCELSGNLHERVLTTVLGNTGTVTRGDGFVENRLFSGSPLLPSPPSWNVAGMGLRSGGIPGIKDRCQTSNRDGIPFSPDRFFYTSGRGAR